MLIARRPALAAFEVCDINPDRIHVTVPAARRVRRRGGDLYVLHQQDLADDQIGWSQQIPTAHCRPRWPNAFSAVSLDTSFGKP